MYAAAMTSWVERLAGMKDLYLSDIDTSIPSPRSPAQLPPAQQLPPARLPAQFLPAAAFCKEFKRRNEE